MLRCFFFIGFWLRGSVDASVVVVDVVVVVAGLVIMEENPTEGHQSSSTKLMSVPDVQLSSVEILGKWWLVMGTTCSGTGKEEEEEPKSLFCSGAVLSGAAGSGRPLLLLLLVLVMVKSLGSMRASTIFLIWLSVSVSFLSLVLLLAWTESWVADESSNHMMMMMIAKPQTTTTPASRQ